MRKEACSHALRIAKNQNSQSLTWAVTHTTRDRDYKNPVARAVHSTARRRNHAKAWSTVAMKREGTLEQGPLGARSKTGTVADARVNSRGTPRSCTKTVQWNGTIKKLVTTPLE